MSIRLVLLASLLLMAPASAGLAAAEDPADVDSLEVLLVEMATTPKQHLALAKYYNAKADAAIEEARLHRSMKRVYTGANIRDHQRMADHCERIVSGQETLAKEYRELASGHSREAGQ